MPGVGTPSAARTREDSHRRLRERRDQRLGRVIYSHNWLTLRVVSLTYPMQVFLWHSGYIRHLPASGLARF
jgi:hypothetical protein